jgi:hypothetical protein
MEPTGPYVGTATVTLSSPQKSTPSQIAPPFAVKTLPGAGRFPFGRG